MGQAVVIGCSSVEFSTEKCTTIGDGGERAKEQISAAAGPGELREKTYVTARADADTALPISVRSQAPTVRMTPRHELAPTGWKDSDQEDFWRPTASKLSGLGDCALAAAKVPAPTGVALSKVDLFLPLSAEEPLPSQLAATNNMNPQEGLLD